MKSYKIANWAAITWLVCIIVVITLLAFATNFFTTDPNFSEGGTESNYLIPFLSSFLLGIISFGIMILSGLIYLSQNKENIKPRPVFGLPIKWILLIVVIIIWGLFSFFFGFRQGSLASMNTTMNEGTAILLPLRTSKSISDVTLWSLIQEWRVNNNLTPFVKDESLCQSERAIKRLQEIKTNWSHEGYERDNFCPNCYMTGENLAKNSLSEKELLDKWLNSPTHRENLEKPYTHACILTDR